MSRPRHPKKEIEEAVQYAEQHGWTVEISQGHAWGRIRCPYGHREHQHSVWSTPTNPTRHARRLRKLVDSCAGAN